MLIPIEGNTPDEVYDSMVNILDSFAEEWYGIRDRSYFTWTGRPVTAIQYNNTDLDPAMDPHILVTLTGIHVLRGSTYIRLFKKAYNVLEGLESTDAVTNAANAAYTVIALQRKLCRELMLLKPVVAKGAHIESTRTVLITEPDGRVPWHLSFPDVHSTVYLFNKEFYSNLF